MLVSYKESQGNQDSKDNQKAHVHVYPMIMTGQENRHKQQRTQNNAHTEMRINEQPKLH